MSFSQSKHRYDSTHTHTHTHNSKYMSLRIIILNREDEKQKIMRSFWENKITKVSLIVLFETPNVLYIKAAQIPNKIEKTNKAIEVHQTYTPPGPTGHPRVMQHHFVLAQNNFTCHVTFATSPRGKSLLSPWVFSTLYCYENAFSSHVEGVSKLSTPSFPHWAPHTTTERFKSQVGSLSLNKWIKDRINRSSNSCNCEIVFIWLNFMQKTIMKLGQIKQNTKAKNDVSVGWRTIKSRQKLERIQHLNERKCTGWELCLYSFSPEGYPSMLNVSCLELKQQYTAFQPEVSGGRIGGFLSSWEFKERRMVKRKDLQKEKSPNLHVNSLWTHDAH